MFKRNTSESGEQRQPRSAGLLTRMANRYSHLYIDLGICIGMLVLLVGMVAAARVLDDWIPLI